ncbi:MAG: hypothetical protein GC162_11955 [Planctomycetes bacterium]|nr:hypothetical protein [Planctomycetota bacterium]
MRRRIREVADRWQNTRLITLTVDRKRWASPRTVWEQVALNALVPRLMRRLGIKRWVWVLEFQTKTGEGWPHWHVLADVGYVEYAEIRRLWWGLWGIGNIDVQKVNAASGAWYLSSYLTKASAAPPWVLAMTRPVRRIAASRLVGRITSTTAEERAISGADGSVPDVFEREHPPTDALRSRPDRRGKPLLWKLAECGRGWMVRLDGRWQWFTGGAVPKHVERLARDFVVMEPAEAMKRVTSRHRASMTRGLIEAAAARVWDRAVRTFSDAEAMRPLSPWELPWSRLRPPPDRPPDTPPEPRLFEGATGWIAEHRNARGRSRRGTDPLQVAGAGTIHTNEAMRRPHAHTEGTNEQVKHRIAT